MIDINRQGEVWVFAEQEAGKLSDVPLELMTKARQLAEKAHELFRSTMWVLATNALARGITGRPAATKVSSSPSSV